MLRSLEIRDLVVLRRAELEPPSGLTAVTGESGAGKTVLAQSLGLLLGGAPDPGAVRPGAKGALVQATLGLPAGFFDDLGEDHPASLVRELLEDETEQEVVVARRVPREGRARALVDGQAAPRDAVASLVGELLRMSGQGEARRLLQGRVQLEVLDAFAGEATVRLARESRRLRREVAARSRALAAARERQAGASREREELEQLVHDVDQIAPTPTEEEALKAERDRLRHRAQLVAAAAEAADAVSRDDGNGALDLTGRAAGALQAATEVDASLAPLSRELEEVGARLQEVALGLRAYLDGLDADPGRLDSVEARLDEYERLARRYGPGIDRVLERTDAARREMEGAADHDQEIERLASAYESALSQAREVAADLRGAREGAAPRLADAVTGELAALAMTQAVLSVSVETGGGEDPPTDRCEMTLQVNPGLPAAPLAEAASGGELSRVLLALHSVAAGAGRETWVFDEVDAGVGGETAGAVAERLARLAEGRQVVVITHLPQVAALAGSHYRLVKGVDEEGRTETRVEPVPDDELVDELCRMLGASSADGGARRHAQELLARRGPEPKARRRRRAA